MKTQLEHVQSACQRWVIVWRAAYEDTDVYVIPEQTYYQILKCSDDQMIHELLCQFPTYENWGEWPEPLLIVGKFML